MGTVRCRGTHTSKIDMFQSLKSSVTLIKDLGFFVLGNRNKITARTVLIVYILFQPLPQGKESDDDISENNNNVVRTVDFYNITMRHQ